jgi:hydroxyatrazine ethylaminohydrolase
MDTLLKNCAAIVPSAFAPVLRDQDMLITGSAIAAIGPGLSRGPLPTGTEVIDASGWFVYPDLINTHHHFFQCFVRNRADLDWTKLSVIEWLDRIYPIFSRLTGEAFYHASVVALAELVKHGCTTAFDHQYCFPRHAGSRIVDRQFEAAAMLGVRFHAGRGANTLPKSEGQHHPRRNAKDDRRLSGRLRAADRRLPRPGPVQHAAGGNRALSAGELLPRDLRRIRPARAGQGRAAAHPCRRGRKPADAGRTGQRTVDYCEAIDFAGPDVWYAHCWELTPGELAQMAASRTGVSHCPEPVYLVGAEVTDIPAMDALGLRIGLGADGAASNDNSNLMHCIHSGYMLQCLVAAGRSHPVPPPAAFLGYATQGGADLLCRRDLGALAPGKAADLFAIDTRRPGYVGTRHDPASLIPKVGIGSVVDMTMISILHASGYMTAPNFSPFGARYHQGTYLMGLAAASLTKSKKLGCVGAFPIPELITSINAYTLGAQSVDPAIEVSVVWVNSWFDPASEQQAAKALLSQGCDVIFSNARDTPSVVTACEAAGAYVFNLNSSMTKYAPRNTLASSAPTGRPTSRRRSRRIWRAPSRARRPGWGWPTTWCSWPTGARTSRPRS